MKKTDEFTKAIFNGKMIKLAKNKRDGECDTFNYGVLTGMLIILYNYEFIDSQKMTELSKSIDNAYLHGIYDGVEL